MMKIPYSISHIPAIVLLKRLLWAMLFLTVARTVFWIYNSEQFEWPGFVRAIKVLFFGAYFDFIGLFYCLSPFILMHLIPGRWFYNVRMQKGLRLFFSFVISVLLILTFIDAGYFPFSKSRLSIVAFRMAFNEDVSLLKYIIDYWGFLPVLIGLVYMCFRFYPRTIKVKVSKPRWHLQVLINLVLLVALILMVRGGFRLKPLRSIDAALFVPPNHWQLAVSSGFSFLESFQSETTEVPTYFSKQKLEQILKTDYFALKSETRGKKKNVVILILESFGKEYTFPEADGAMSHTPFLAELARKSTFYTSAYANGNRSVDAIPAILEGVPKLTNTDFMYTSYIGNTTPGLPYYLKKVGYECSFYHGGLNGTMGFEAFLKARGWNYFGKNEYTGDVEDFDGHWGIFDGPYLQYVARQLKQHHQPFVASVFTLSSHHPYTLPPTYIDSFRNLKEPIHKTIRYTDHCLKHFFESIQNESWFSETVFVITGDHSGWNFSQRYQTRSGKYEVPLLVYEPSNENAQTCTDITQHIDIVPMVLEKLRYSGNIFTVGTWFDTPENKMAFQNEEGSYQFITPGLAFTFDGSSFDFGNLPNLKNRISVPFFENRAKTKIQDFHYRMTNNRFY